MHLPGWFPQQEDGDGEHQSAVEVRPGDGGQVNEPGDTVPCDQSPHHGRIGGGGDP